MFVSKRPKVNEKEAEIGPFFSKSECLTDCEKLVTSNASLKTSSLLLSTSAEAEIDHEVEGGVEDGQQVVDADQDEDPLQEKFSRVIADHN